MTNKKIVSRFVTAEEFDAFIVNTLREFRKSHHPVVVTIDLDETTMALFCLAPMNQMRSLIHTISFEMSDDKTQGN